MEGHGEAFCGLYKAAKEGLVYSSVGRGAGADAA